MCERHKWADVAIAFAEGKVIQRQNYETGEWVVWNLKGFPPFYEGENWRVKPADPVVRYKWAYRSTKDSPWAEGCNFLSEKEAQEYFGSVTLRFKLEYTRTEFPAEDNA